jgi:hypothetical protein
MTGDNLEVAVSTTFLALYRGESVATARLVAVSSEPEIVARYLRELAGESGYTQGRDDAAEPERLRLLKDSDYERKD